MTWIAISAVAVMACHEMLAPDQVMPPSQKAQSEQALNPSADTYVSSRYPNANYGTDPTLRVERVHPNRTTRALVAWSPQAIAQAVGSDSVVAARFEVTIVSNEGGWGAAGGLLSLHPMVAPVWSENEATWSCSDASCFPPWNMANPQPCDEVHGEPPPECWEPWTPTPTDTVRITNGQAGTVSFDVTADVVSSLQGTFWPSVTRWLVKKVDEAASGGIVFGSRESASPPRLVLTLVPNGSTSQVPEVAPDTVPEGFFAPENIRMGTACMSGRTLRGIVVVSFKEGTTQPEKQAAIDLIGGEVVGGVRSRDDIEGWYYVRVEDDPEGQILCDAIETLNALPQVSYASEELFAASFYRRPVDGPGWTTEAWQLDPALLQDSERWGLEAVAAPLAWGCEVGRSQTPVAVIDQGFQNVADLVDSIPQQWKGDVGVNTTSDHGTKTASILAALGNNQAGISGIMWRADLRPYDVDVVNGTLVLETSGQQALTRIVDRVAKAAEDGAGIINLSMGIGWQDEMGRLPGEPGDLLQVSRYRNRLRDALVRIPEQPVLVLASGNDGVDASWAGFPEVQLDFPERVLVVAASNIGQNLTPTSNRGSLPQVAAPGELVGALDGVGNTTRLTGTSYAAPYVAGVAGLLASFDPQLTTAQIKQLILEGAARGGRTAGGIPLLNAYESLRAAAERPGAPLCGQHVWAADGGLYVRRTPGAPPERLGDVPSPSYQMEVLHGGKIIWFLTESGGRVLGWNPVTRSWATAPLPPNVDELRGGAWASVFGVSHDLDERALIDETFVNQTLWYYSGQSEDADVLTGPLSGPLSRITGIRVDNMPEPIQNTCIERNPATGVCHFSITERRQWMFRIGYPQFPEPQGAHQAYVTVSSFQVVEHDSTEWEPCSFNPSHECRLHQSLQKHREALVYTLDLAQPDAVPTAVDTIPDETVFWIGLGENGEDVVLMRGRWLVTTWADPARYYQTGSPYLPPEFEPQVCVIDYRARATFQPLAASPPIAVSSSCLFGTFNQPSNHAGHGTIAPSVVTQPMTASGAGGSSSMMKPFHLGPPVSGQ